MGDRPPAYFIVLEPHATNRHVPPRMCASIIGKDRRRRQSVACGHTIHDDMKALEKTGLSS